MFDISLFTAQQKRIVEIKKPDGTQIIDKNGDSPWIEVFPKGSIQYAKAISAAQHRAKDATTKRGVDATEALKANATQLLADCIGDSNFTGPDGSPLRGANAWRAYLDDPTKIIIRDQVDVAIGEANLEDGVDFLI